MGFGTSSPILRLLPLGALAALFPACGGGSDIDMGAAGRGGSGGTSGQGGSAGVVTSGTGGASAGGGSGATGGDTCGGKPCADHTGSKDFITGGATPDAPDTFGKGTSHDPGSDPAREPGIVYPNHETMFPINVSRIRHDWSAGGSNALFRLLFEGPRTTVNV
ncbi:MAG TPA: hypothetical protein VMS65_05490, partial [Polyangiaceae bacterium]|nr:hypothetical protein [Polyangiaceae bacterium]